jgi:hypothetical protein
MIGNNVSDEVCPIPQWPNLVLDGKWEADT